MVAPVPGAAGALVAYDPALLQQLHSLSGGTTKSSGNTAPGSSSVASDTATSRAAISSPILASFPSLVSDLDGFTALLAETTLENQGEAYKLFSSGKVSLMPVQTVGQQPYGAVSAGPSAQCCVKTGYVHNGDTFVIKIAAGGAVGYGNTGFLLVFSQKTMQLCKQLNDSGILTEIRTAAATCYASRLIWKYGAPRPEQPPENNAQSDNQISDITSIGILGAGVQAWWQLRFLQLITPCRNVRLWTRDAKKGKEFVENLNSSAHLPDREWDVTFCSDVGDVGQNCELIHTLTCSREELLITKHLFSTSNSHQSRSNSRGNSPVEEQGCSEQELRTGGGALSAALAVEPQEATTTVAPPPSSCKVKRQHISAVGADAPGKQELGVDVLLSADLLVCDSVAQSLERGEFQRLLQQSSNSRTNTLVEADRIVEIGTLAMEMEAGGEATKLSSGGTATGLTIFDTSGIAVQDVAIAEMVVKLLEKKEQMVAAKEDGL
ncbi:unnamed protein product [Amoebophrya sp. A120]|nr:unnamed protein product [Amoebophrya sp. A120]|eukprot:GSA120T00000776001.1